MSDDPAEVIASYARTAYAQGWAASGGPMTDTVRAGCLAAIENAVAHADDPRVLEVTFHLGHLEGVWAALYARREALRHKHTQAVAAAWRAASQVLDLSVAIGRYRASLGAADVAHAAVIADTIAASVVQALTPSAAPDTLEPVIRAIATALKDAEAEGWAAGTAITAHQRGVIGIDFDLPFEDAWAALGDLGTYWADATGWLGAITDGVAGDLGRTLARLAADGAGYDEMLAGARDVLSGQDLRAVETLLDMAMSQSFSRGALALYRREGVTTVDYLTAGTRVCKICDGYESKNPWPIADVPHPGVHPHCRCVLAPSTSSLWDPITALAAA